MSVAVITGGSAGLGRALATTLVDQGWAVVVDARRPGPLVDLAREGIVTRQGDVADPVHRAELARTVASYGGLDLLVHGASTLGPLPMRRLRDLSEDDLRAVWAVNTAAPLALTRLLLDALHAADGALVSVSSDAAVEHYPGWGGYAASKASLDHLTLTLGEEERLTAYAVDPGDMRTRMHQDAFPGEDISDRPAPETVVPHLLALLATRPPSGRYRLADVPVPAATGREA